MLFLLENIGRELVGHMVSRVDDFQLAVARGNEQVGAALAAECNLEWEATPYTYCGCEHYLQDNVARITQREYTQRPMEVMDVPVGRTDDVVTYEERVANQSAVGGVSWLSAHTQPDLASRTAFCQKRHKYKSMSELRMMAHAITHAKGRFEVGLTVPAMYFDDSAILAFHDASFANVTDDGVVWPDKALVTDEQLANKWIFSQVGYVVMIAQKMSWLASRAKPVLWNGKATL